MPIRDNQRTAGLFVYLLLGAFFGIVLIKSEVVSWFRIQEMFRFQSIHMYGVIGSAVVVAGLSLALARRFGPRDQHGRPPRIEGKPWATGQRLRYVVGGVIFGFGWALTGSCPGPIYALIGHGASGAVVVLLSALVGARAYAAVAERIPH